jgi:hypothetical protein
MRFLIVTTAALALSVGCSRADSPTTPAGLPGGSTEAGAGAQAVSGGGHYLLQGAFETQFAFSAVQHRNGTASGNFHHRTADSSGTIDFTGRVTCVAVDAANRRAWIGGVITDNRSTNPGFMTPVHAVGHDIWFRVLDGGEGQEATDRTTFVGFESAAIPTSASYCEQRIWPQDAQNPNLRTWPVTSGNISVPN